MLRLPGERAHTGAAPFNPARANLLPPKRSGAALKVRAVHFWEKCSQHPARVLQRHVSREIPSSARNPFARQLQVLNVLDISSPPSNPVQTGQDNLSYFWGKKIK